MECSTRDLTESDRLSIEADRRALVILARHLPTVVCLGKEGCWRSEAERKRRQAIAIIDREQANLPMADDRK